MIAAVVALAVVAFVAWFVIELRQAPHGCDDCGGVNDCWACGAVADRRRADR